MLGTAGTEAMYQGTSCIHIQWIQEHGFPDIAVFERATPTQFQKGRIE